MWITVIAAGETAGAFTSAFARPVAAVTVAGSGAVFIPGSGAPVLPATFAPA